jgi:glycosyltransferase involved in cell wall biosynthesis
MADRKRLLIVEEGLRGLEIGHWYEHIKTIAGACRERGAEVTIAAHRKASPRVIEDLQALPLIPVSAWEPGRAPGNALRRYVRVLRHNFVLYRTIARLLNTQPHPFDCVFAPTMLINHLLAWRWLVRRFAGKKFERCVLCFLNPPGRRAGPGGSLVFPRSTRLMRRVLGQLRPEVEAGRVRLAGETRRVAENFQAFCGIEFEVAPQPVALQKLEHQPHPGKPLLACYGFARFEKGSDLLQAALLRLLDDRGALPARFLIQWRGDFPDETGRTVRPEPRLRECPDVEFVERAFDTEEYTRRLSQTDGIVLPYRRDSYYDRDSRVAIDAAVLGIPTVYTGDTWLEQCATHCGAGVGFKDQDVAGLAAAVEKLVANLPHFQRMAEEKTSVARDYFSPQRFAEWLMDMQRESRATASRVVF